MSMSRSLPAERVLVLLPTARAAERVKALLAAVGLTGTACQDLCELGQKLAEGAEAVLLSEGQLRKDKGSLARTLAEQPAWSALPFIVLGRRSGHAQLEKHLGQAAANVTLIEGPVRPQTLLSILQAAVRARKQQYQMRDAIAERERQREALKSTEERYRTLVEVAPQIVWVGQSSGTISYLNQQWFDLTGLSMAESAGLGWTRAIHPEHVERVLAVWRDAASRATSYEVELAIRRASDSEYRWHLCRGAPVRSESGRIEHWIGVATDVTDRKRAEETAQLLAAVSASLAEFVDTRSILSRVAAQVVPVFADWCAADLLAAPGQGDCERIAVRHADPEKGQLARELMEKNPSSPDASHGLGRVLRTGEAELLSDISQEKLQEIAGDCEHLRILNELGCKSLLRVPLVSHGRVFGAFTFVRATPGRRYGEKDLQTAADLARRATVAIENANLNRALKDADRRKDEFLATLAHELRNPLAPIRTGLEFLQMAPPESAAKKVRSMMERQLGHMVRLIDDLLDVSRITRGTIELKKQRITLQAAVEAALEASRPFIEGGKHVLTISIANEPIWVQGDLTRLAEAMSNLLNNAAKYTPSGGHIELVARQEKDVAVVQVRDNGCGIPQDQLSAVFEMFTQVNRKIDRAQGGLGIGLALVRKLMEMHGGTVEASSPGVNQGSTFTIRLPVAPPLETLVPKSTSVPPPPSHNKRRILVVDDNLDGAESLSMLLGLAGHATRTAHNGPDALTAAAEFKPEVVFLDIGLPGMNGYEVARKLRSAPDFASTTLIALTGWGSEDDKARARAAGFDFHLTKPVDAAQVQSLLGRLS